MSAVNKLVELLGEDLLSKNGTIKTNSVNKKVVMLYFSAHWCPPCRGFTPRFAEFYDNLKDKLSMEVIFISSDKDKKSFEDYYSEMPWLAVPFEKCQVAKEKLPKVNGIPSVLLINPENGEVYEENGRKVVIGDPEGKNFPWIPPTLEEILGSFPALIRNDGSKVSMESLKDKYLGLYFSAHWCPPCKQFTPKLIETYKHLAERNDFELIFISSDKSESEFTEYFSTMPWLSLTFDQKVCKSQLDDFFQVEGIPALFILDKDHKTIINKAARSSVLSDPLGKEFPWHPKPVQSVEEGAEELNNMPSLIVMMENEKDTTIKQFEAVLSSVSEKHLADLKEGKVKNKIQFLMGGPEGKPILDQVRRLTKTNDLGTETRTLCNGDMCLKLHNSTTVLLLDIPDGGGFYKLEGELTVDNIYKFIQDFASKTLSRQQLAR